MAGTGGYQDEDSGGGAIADINVTPLVDIVLVLLIIFMVTAKLIAERGISVDNPKTVSGDAVSSTLALTIGKSRVLHVNGKAYEDPDRARARVEQARRDNPEIKAVISADQSVPHGDVMEVIDMVKVAGVRKFALATDPKPEGAPGAGAGEPEEGTGSGGGADE